MPETLATIGYLTAGILFILSLGGLSQKKTARRGMLCGIVGMVLGISVTFAMGDEISWAMAVGPIIAGAVVGLYVARQVAMTALPELVAILHSLGGLAAVLVAMGIFLGDPLGYEGTARTVQLFEIYVAVAVGAFTFTGSIIAWGKLSGKISSNPFMIPGRHGLNAAICIMIVALGVPFVSAGVLEWLEPVWILADPRWLIAINAVAAAVVGAHLIMAIGGADMPVVVSMLNSYSGWAAAACGFMLSNDLLIVTGALVGSSGAILSYMMCQGMDRPFLAVILGGFGTGTSKSNTGPGMTKADARSTHAHEVAELLRRSRRVAIVPGYGMAVAQAQHAISQLTRRLREAGKEVCFPIHPVAGRMPGHMNVLLGEAKIPYDLVCERDEINDEFCHIDTVIVVGANDVVNPDALDDESSPIFGMPQLEVWEAATVVVCKRSMSPGYAGVPNPLFVRENTWMLFGDAKEKMDELLAAWDHS
jgi:H+-translocating NAD(P) transhydrogenase subunit beta